MELTDIQKKDKERFREKQTFDDGNAKGSILIDEVSLKTFLEFRQAARDYFGNKDGSALTTMLQLFLAEKSRQKILEDRGEAKL